MVRLVIRERPEGWDIDSTRLHGPNVVSCEIVTGIQWTPFIRDYLPPSNMDRLPDLEEALNVFLGRDTISWEPEQICWLYWEPLEPSGVRLHGIFQDVIPIWSLQETSKVPY